MKKTFLMLALAMISFGSQAQDKKSTNEFNHVLKTNVLGYLAGQYQISYEKPLNEHFSVQLSAGFLTGNNSGSLGVRSYKGHRIGLILIPEARYYFKGNAPKGFYLGAFARYRSASNILDDQSFTAGGTGIDQDLSRVRRATSIGGGVLIGYQLITKGGFTFDIFAGPQYKSRSTKITYDNDALNVPSTVAGYDSKGDELFSSKFGSIDYNDKAGMGLRFGFNIGFAF